MKTLTIFDAKNYKLEWQRFSREAVRAIIIKNDKIALVKCIKEGYYKFPGGGIEAGETHEQTLIRETLEETGLHVLKDSIKEFGTIHELRKSLHRRNEIFDQKSHYYFASVSDNLSSPKLDKYEAELGYVLEWASIDEAYETNMKIGKRKKSSFLFREAYVLDEIRKLGIMQK